MVNSGDILLRPTGSGTLAYSGPGAWALHQNEIDYDFDFAFDFHFVGFGFYFDCDGVRV